MDGKRKRSAWSDVDELTLLNLWAENVFELRQAKQTKHIYTKIAAALKTHTAQEVKKKIFNFTQRYRYEKKHTVSFGWPSAWRHYEAVHQFLGGFPARKNTTVKHDSFVFVKEEYSIAEGSPSFAEEEYILDTKEDSSAFTENESSPYTKEESPGFVEDEPSDSETSESNTVQNEAALENDYEVISSSSQSHIQSTPFKMPRKKQKLTNPDISAMVKQMTEAGEKLENRREFDQIQIFGDYVTAEMKKYNSQKYSRILAKLKHAINSALYSAEMERIDLDTDCDQRESCSSRSLCTDSPSLSSPQATATHIPISVPAGNNPNHTSSCDPPINAYTNSSPMSNIHHS